MAEWDDFRPALLWLLHVDIAGHSTWALEASSLSEVMRARAKLATKFTNALIPYGFERAFWAGDGGLFYADRTRTESSVIAPTVDQVFEEFELWRDKSQGRKSLAIRVCLHCTEVYCGKEPGLWLSPELNDFLKHERALSEPDTAVVTDAVYKHLSLEQQIRWHDLGQVTWNGSARPWRRYYDVQRPPQTADLPFGEWLERWPKAKAGPRAAQLKNLLGACGEAGLLIRAPSAQGIVGGVNLKQVDGVSWIAGLESGSEQKQSDFVKLAPVSLTSPMTDGNDMTLEWVPCMYRHVAPATVPFR